MSNKELVPINTSKRVIIKNEDSSEEEYSSDESKVPAILEEPVDDDAVIYTENKIRKKPKPINLNVPLDQPVLLETESPKEFDEMEDKIVEFDKGMDTFGFFESKNKREPKIEYTGFSSKIKFILEQCKSNDIPIISINSPIEFLGADKISTLIQTIKKYNSSVTVIATGPFYNGSGFSSTSFNGKHIIDIFNKLNIDFINFGNTDHHLDSTDFLDRITEFKGTALCTNLKNLNGTKISKTTSYLLRDYTFTKLLYIGISEENNCSYLKTVNEINVLKDIFEKFKNKYEFAVLLSTCNDLKNKEIAEKFPEIKLICSNFNNNNLYTHMNCKIGNSEPNFKSVYLHILKKDEIISHLIPIDETIPKDENLKITLRYWSDLGYKELKTLNTIDPNQTIIKLSTELTSDKLLQMILLTIEKKFDEFQINAVCLSKNLINKNSIGTIKGYDIYQIIPYIDRITILSLDKQTYTESSIDPNLTNKIVLNNNIGDKIVVATTEQTIEKYITEYISGDFTATICTDIRLLIYEILVNLNMKN